MTAGEKALLESKLENDLAERRGKEGGGLRSEEALVVAFQLIEVYFRLYRLNKLHVLLQEIKPHCFEKGDESDWIPKWLQAQATNLCKQNRYKEALPLFTEMAERLTPTSALLSNVGNVYLALGQLHKAQVNNQHQHQPTPTPTNTNTNQHHHQPTPTPTPPPTNQH